MSDFICPVCGNRNPQYIGIKYEIVSLVYALCGSPKTRKT